MKINSKKKIYVEISILLGIFCLGTIFNPLGRNSTIITTQTQSPKISSSLANSNPNGDEWPMFHGSLNHTGVWNSPIAFNNNSFGIAITNGSIVSAPAVANDSVYVGSDDDNLYCFNATNGTLIWNYTTGNMVESSPAIANNLVYFGSYDNNMYCLYANNGTLDWNYTTGDMIDSSPAVSNGMVFFGSEDNNIYCLNSTTGAKIWNYTTGSPVASSPAISNGFLYIGSYDSNMYCLYANNGTLDWNYTTDGFIFSSPTVSNGTVYFGSSDNNTYCLNATTGTKIWNYTTGDWVLSSPAVSNGLVYVGSFDNNTYCLYANNGTLDWKYTTGNIIVSSPAVSNGMVYFGSDDNNTYCLNATNGKLAWNFTTGDLIESSPAISNGSVFIGSYDDLLYCLPLLLPPIVPPSNFNVMGGNGNATLSWQAPSVNGGSPITGYNIYRGTSSGNETLVKTLGNVLNYTDTGLTNEQTYYYEITAINAVGEGMMSSEFIVIPEIPPNASNGTEWPMFRGSLNHTGVINSSLAFNLNSLGIINITNGIIFSSPAVVNGLVYVGSEDDNLYCFNATTGNIVWNYTTGDMIDSSPSVSNGMVYFGSYDDNLYCLNAFTGSLIWNYTTGSSVFSSPAVSNGMVYFGSEDNNTYCLYANNGTLDWNYTTGAPIDSSPAVSNGLVYIGSFDNNMYCLYANNGTLDWSYTTSAPIVSSPAVSNGMVFFGSFNNNIYCLNAFTGAKVWNYTTGSAIASSPAVSNGMVYFGSSDNNTYCLYANNGTLAWNYTTGGAINTSPAVSNGMVYFGSEDNNTYCLYANNGTLAWNFTTDDMIESSPAISNGSVIIGSNDYSLYCLPLLFPPFEPPSNFNVIGGDENATLSWQAPSSNGGSAITGYNIYRGTTSGNEALVKTLGNVLNYTDTGLVNGQTYYYEITAKNAVGEGMMSSEFIVIPEIPPNTSNGNEWSMFRGSLNNTGVMNSSVAFNLYSLGIINITSGMIFSSPAIVNGLVYVGSEDDNFYCFNETTGNIVWNYTTGGWVDSSPTISNGMVYFGSYDDKMYCLNAFTGTLIWNYTTGGPVFSSPAVSNGMVYFGSEDNNTYCLYANNGTLDWNYTTGDMIDSSPAISNGMVYFGSFDNNTYCLYANNGTLDWNYTTGGPVFSSPAVSNGLVYFGSFDNNTYCLYVNNGTLDWNYTTGGPVFSSPAVSNGMVYFGSYDDKMYCLNAFTGTLIWNYTTGSYVDSSPTISNGMVYFGSTDNNTYCLYANNGILAWNFTTSDWVESSPAISNGSVFIGSDDYSLYCLPLLFPPFEPPSNFTVAGGDGKVTLSWQAPSSNGGSDITGYIIYRSTVSGTETFLVTVGNVLTYTDTGLINGQTYYYEISAINAVGNGTISSEISVIPSTPPTAPQNLQASISGDKQVILTWQIPSSSGGFPISGYKIYRGLTSGNETLIATLGSVTTYIDPGLTNGQTYYYKVCAINSVGDDGINSSIVNIKVQWNPSAPQNLTTSISGNGQVTLTWKVPSDNGGSVITWYKIYRGTTSGSESLIATIAASNTNYIDSGLTDGQPYYYKVCAINSVGDGPNSSEVNITVLWTPSAPQNLQATATNETVTLSWQAPSSNGGKVITGYNIYRGTASGSETLIVTIFNGTKFDYSDSGLINGQIYYYKVSANNSLGEGSQSSEVSGIPALPPSAPQNFQITIGNQQLTLSWQTPLSNGGSSIIKYNIYRSTTHSGSETLWKTVGNQTTYIDTNLTNGQIYYYRVSAVNSQGPGTLSNETSAIPAIIPPTAPQDLTITTGNGFAVLSWLAPSNNGGSTITGYIIYRSTTSGSEILYKTIGDLTTYTDIGLINGQTYYYKIRAINAGGDGNFSSEQSCMPFSVPDAPLNIIITAYNKSLVLTWNPPSSDNGSAIIGYKIYRSTVPGNETLIATLNSTLTTFIDTGLITGQTYYYRISAINAAGEGLKSKEQSSAPTGIPGAPQSLSAKAGNGYIQLSWKAPANKGGLTITAYKIYRGTSSGNEVLIGSVGNVLNYTDAGLTNGQKYYYTIKAVNSLGTGNQSIEIHATPTSKPSGNSIGGMGIGILLPVSMVSVVIVIFRAKKRLNLTENLRK